MPDVAIVRLDPELPLPAYAKDGDAGIDLFAREHAYVSSGGGRVLVPTGIAIAIPPGHGGFLLPRSGLALKSGLTLLNAPGLIDAGYRDEVKVVVVNTDPVESYEIHRGDRIAQLIILPVEPINWVVEDGFDGEHRGGGFGHTGR